MSSLGTLYILAALHEACPHLEDRTPIPMEELKLGYHNSETILFGICPYGNLIGTYTK